MPLSPLREVATSKDPTWQLATLQNPKQVLKQQFQYCF
jgi:hypothetical protein